MSECNPKHGPEMACDSCVDARGGMRPWTAEDEAAFQRRHSTALEISAALGKALRLGEKDRDAIAGTIELEAAQEYERGLKRGRSATPPSAAGVEEAVALAEAVACQFADGHLEIVFTTEEPLKSALSAYLTARAKPKES